MKRGRTDAESANRKKAIRVRFQKLVRTVLMNQHWLVDVEDQGMSMNPEKNVALLVRQKKKRGMITVADKALLRTLPWMRTIEDRKRLCTVLAGLTCFAKIPPKIRARLVPVIKLMSVDESRVLIKEGDLPITVYFILNGEVEMKRSEYNKTTKEITQVSTAIFGPGDCVGDVEMVEDCPRMNTYTTQANCEILALFDNDYNQILKPFMEKQWNEKKIALRTLPYFDFLNDDQIRRACMFGSLVQYEPLETMYAEDKGNLSMVHFILSGECVILQCLNLKVTYRNGRPHFELTDIEKDNESKAMFHDLRPNASTNASDYSHFDVQRYLLSSTSDENEERAHKKLAIRKMGLKEIEAHCQRGNTSLPEKAATRKSVKLTKRFTQKIPRRSIYESEQFETEDDEEEGQLFDYEDYFEYFGEGVSIGSEFSLHVESSSSGSEHKALGSMPSHFNAASGQTIHKSYSSKQFGKGAIQDHSNSSSKESLASSMRDPYSSHFIDVGSLTYGAIIGLGEKMEHRVIMARTVVQCLILPRFWLLEDEQNPADIWPRRRFYFETCVPSRKALFEDYKKTQRWEQFRNDYIELSLDASAKSNATREEDIPIMCRIVETSDQA